jgi:hypothetical protein
MECENNAGGYSKVVSKVKSKMTCGSWVLNASRSANILGNKVLKMLKEYPVAF